MKQIEQIRLIHKAFEKEPNHIATYVPSPLISATENLEELFKRTQNLDESWIKFKQNFSMIPTVDTRSTSVGDLMVCCYENPNGNGYKEVWYKVADAGFEKWFDKKHIANDHLKEKYKKGGTA